MVDEIKCLEYDNAIKRIARDNTTVNLFDVSYLLSLIYDSDKQAILNDLVTEKERQTKLILKLMV